MKKLLLAFLLLCSVAGIAQVNPPFIPRRGSADPNGSLACNPGTGSLASLLYFRTSGTVGWYECTAAPNTWALWGTNSITGMTDPTTTTGDLIYRSSGGTSRLAGNTTTTRKFLRQTGTGSASAAPVWDTLVAGDIPDISASYALASHTHAESDVTGLVSDLAAKSPIASPTFTGTVAIPSLTMSSITGSAQCLHVNSSGVVSGTGSDCGSGGGSSFYQTIDANGTPVTQRAASSYSSEFTVADNSGASRTDISINAIAESKVTSLSSDLAALAPKASPTFSGTVTVSITGSTQCLHVNSSGVISGTGADCGVGGGGVSAFSGDGSLISNSASTGTVTVTLANAAAHSFWGNNTGSTGAPGYHTLGLSDLPSGVGLTASRIDQNNASTTSAQLASIISDETGSGGLVFGTSPTIVTPTIASFANATHNHTNSAGGGQLTGAAMSSFDISGLTVTSAFKPPASAGASPATDGVVAFDTTAHALVYGSNGTKVQAAAFSGSAPTSGDCVTWGSNGKVTDSGVVGCGGLSNPMIATGDLVKGGSSGVPARLAVNNDSVPQYVVSVSGDTSLVPGGVPVNAQTGTSYTVLKTDRLGLVTTSNASAIAVTLAQAQTTGDFANNFALVTKNLGAGTATWTPTTSSIDGGSSLALSQGEWCLLYSNNADYTSACSDGHITAGTNVNLSRSSSGVQIGLTGVDLPSNRIDQNNASTSSAQFASVISDETGTGVVVLQTSPNLITPSLGVATATSVNKVALTAPATGSTLTIADGKTFTVSNTITLTGTDSASYAMPTGSATVFGSTTKADALESALFCADAGSTDTYTCSLSPAISSYVAHRAYCFKANTINTGAATINFNSVGALTIKKPNGGSITSDLADGDIRAGQEVCGVYDGTNFQMTSQIGNSPVGSGTVTSVQNTVNGASSSGIFTVSGGPITGSGTINIALAGTSGGVPYFSSSSVLSSSSALTSNSVVLGGGAGAAPKVIAGITTDGTSKLTLGVAGTSVGASCFTNATSGTICLQPVTGALGTDTISIPARNSVVMATTSGSLTNGDVASYDSNGNLVDSTVVAANLTTQSSNGAANQVCTYTGANKVCVPGTVTGSMMTNNTVTATQLAAQYSKGSCTEVWSGSGTSSALQSGDDAISNNTCYNDSGVTRTITAVKCRSSAASNTTTVNPTFGSAGTGTTILSGALTCGSSYAYSSSGTVSNASWTTGSGIDPAMGGTLTGSSISVIVEYTY